MVGGGAGSHGRRTAEVHRGRPRGRRLGDNVLGLGRASRVEGIVARRVASRHGRLGARRLVYPAAGLGAVEAPVAVGDELLLAGHAVMC